MTLNNEEERRAWVAFAASGGSDFADSLATWADRMIEEYRARLPKAEEPTGPDWSTAPEWAEWWAQDNSGFRVWYFDEPRILGDDCWELGSKIATDSIDLAKYTGPYVYPGDWRDSKMRRPK